MKKIPELLLVIVTLLGPTSSAYATLFLTADKDLRYQDDEVKVEALGLNLRKVLADERGDRIILFTTVEAMHDFQDIMIDQAYVQYRGPMGIWNLTAGRYLLPFGLLPNYSTKRLLIDSLEHEMIGIRSDQGLKLSGLINNFDYAVSVSKGTGVARWTDIDNDWLVTSRVGYQGVDFEDLRVGLSVLLGSVLPDRMDGMKRAPKYKRLVALDFIQYYGPLVWRAEIAHGEEQDRTVNGLFTGVDYALFPRVDLNLGYTYLDRAKMPKNELFIGLTYNIAGFQIRGARKIQLGGNDKDEFLFQVYKAFTRTF
jgi:hypothetical protein